MDQWLERSALRDQDLGISCTHVWVDDGEEMIVGYYTLLPTAVREVEGESLWKRLKPSKQYWGNEVYGVLIGKVALDQSLRGKGVGVDLLGEAIYTAGRAMDLVGGVYVVIEPMEDRPRLRAMYEEYGFETVQDATRMYMRIDEFRTGGIHL